MREIGETGEIDIEGGAGFTTGVTIAGDFGVIIPSELTTDIGRDGVDPNVDVDFANGSPGRGNI